jgi:phospholipase/carboxylesterase
LSSHLGRAISRREFIVAAGAVPLAIAASCGDPTAPVDPSAGEPARLRLTARKPSRGTVLGTDVLYDANLRRAYLRVPPNYSPDTPAPLIIAFHGSGGRGEDMIAGFGARTDAIGAILLAPDSLLESWDVVTDHFGNDIALINEALDQTFARCNINASAIALLGFSDGASYALSVGLANGDQLAGVVAFSPGFYVLDHPHGTPRYFLSHGKSDSVIPIETSSREIVPALRARGSTVDYVEFDGGHVVPAAVSDQAMTWLDARL